MTGKNTYLVYTDAHCLAFGGGYIILKIVLIASFARAGRFGLWIDKELDHGHSEPSLAFGNENLSTEADFRIQEIEIWYFHFDVRFHPDKFHVNQVCHCEMCCHSLRIYRLTVSLRCGHEIEGREQRCVAFFCIPSYKMLRGPVNPSDTSASWSLLFIVLHVVSNLTWQEVGGAKVVEIRFTVLDEGLALLGDRHVVYDVDFSWGKATDSI